MADIRNLINQLAAQEKLLSEIVFLAPCVKGGSMRISVDSMMYTLTPLPKAFQGWGIFQPINNQEAELIETPSLPQIAEYLSFLKPLQLRLVCCLQGQTWLAYPIDELDMQQRFGMVKPVVVNLVTQKEAKTAIIARYDGHNWWSQEAIFEPTVNLTQLEGLRCRNRWKYWQIEYTQSNGQKHSSTINKTDLKVMSFGVCLTGGDRHLDFQSFLDLIS